MSPMFRSIFVVTLLNYEYSYLVNWIISIRIFCRILRIWYLSMKSRLKDYIEMWFFMINNFIRRKCVFGWLSSFIHLPDPIRFWGFTNPFKPWLRLSEARWHPERSSEAFTGSLGPFKFLPAPARGPEHNNMHSAKIVFFFYFVLHFF